MSTSMKNTMYKANYSHRSSLAMMSTACLLLALAVILTSCGAGGGPVESSESRPADASTEEAKTATGVEGTTKASENGYPIKVYFSKAPEGIRGDMTEVFPVDRISPTEGVAAYAIQMLIAGPTVEERNAGYFTELNSMLTGPSSCTSPAPEYRAGPDFQLTLDKKGETAELGTATLKFCRQIISSGIGTDARVQAQITNTLKQFPTIKKVVILLQDGHCFGDQSGMDVCLR